MWASLGRVVIFTATKSKGFQIATVAAVTVATAVVTHVGAFFAGRKSK